MSQMTDAEKLAAIQKRYHEALHDVLLVGFIPVSIAKLDEMMWGTARSEVPAGMPYWVADTNATHGVKSGTVWFETNLTFW